MNRKIGISACLLILLLLVASCSTTKKLERLDYVDAFSETEYMEKVLSNSAEWSTITAKMSVNLNLKGKKTGKVNGVFRIKRGEVIQILLVPFLGIEVGRAEISPDGLLVIDRMNKRYVQVGYEELKTRTHVDLTYSVLEALFLNEVFLPGKETLTIRDKSSFDWEVVASEVRLSVKKSKPFNYKFLTEAPEGWLKRSHVGLKNTSYALNWYYDDFKPLGQSAFPTYMQMSFEGGREPIAATFNFSRLSTNDDWEAHTEISQKYHKVELEEVIKMLFK